MQRGLEMIVCFHVPLTRFSFFPFLQDYHINFEELGERAGRGRGAVSGGVGEGGGGGGLAAD